jgi:DNA-binding beta-propeller fold protein YncE
MSRLSGLLIGFCFLWQAGYSQQASQQTPPQLPYRTDGNWPNLPAGWNFGEAEAAAVDAEGNVYVFHRGPHPIIVFDPQGRYLRSFGDGLFVGPHGLRIDRDGNLWAADSEAHIVLKIDLRGRVQMVLGRRRRSGETDAMFNQPTDVAVDSNGNVYVTDGYGNSRIVKFASDGRFLQSWGKPGSGKGEFNWPHSIVIDRQDHIYVADRRNNRVQIFDTNGKFLDQWTHVGTPMGLALAEDESLFMTEGSNNRVLEMNLEGRILGAFGEKGKRTGQFDICHQLAVDADKNLYVAEVANWRVQKLVRR